MIILVCGGRAYRGDVSCLAQIVTMDDIIVHGGASGADLRAARWAKGFGIHTAQVDAIWDFYGKAAGYQRNSAMLRLRPEYCVAFPGGPGTAMMAGLCRETQIPVWVPYGGVSDV